MSSTDFRDKTNLRRLGGYMGDDADELLERETFAVEAKKKRKKKSSKKTSNENQYDMITNPEFVSPRSDSKRFQGIEKNLTFLKT